MKRLCVLLYLAILFIPAMGQNDSTYVDTIKVLNNLPQFNWQDDPQNFIQVDAHYYKLYMPLTFYRTALKQTFAVNWPNYYYPEYSSPLDSLFTYDKKAFTIYDDIDTMIDKGLTYVYTHTYNKIENWDYEIEGLKIPNMYNEKFYRTENRFIDLFKPEPMYNNNNLNRVRVKFFKPNFWNITGNGSIQFSQSYISRNWYEGGQSADALQSNLQLDANYNDNNKIEWDNRLELKLGFQTSSDTIHKYIVNDNLMRLTSKLGYKATTDWYYTISVEFNTQLYNTYKSNSEIKQSSFLSPFNVIAGIGMNYKKKTKRIDLSVVLAPVAYNLCYISNVGNMDVTSYNIQAGDHSRSTIGSTMTTDLVWTVNSMVKYTTRLNYFSNYNSTQADWENTINFTLNKYLSTKIFLNGRFDDSATKSGTWRYFQLKDILSFGLNYTW